MYVTVNGSGGSPNGGTGWGDAFSMAEFLTDLTTNSESGDIYYVDSGTYTVGGAVDVARSGSPTGEIRIIGVTGQNTPVTIDDWATGDDRPLFDLEGNVFAVDNWWANCNLRFSGTATTMVRGDAGTLWKTCKFERTTAGATSQALYIAGSGARAVDCEITNASGRGALLANYSQLVSSHVHDSLTGLQINGNACIVSMNLLDGCTTAVSLVGNRIYNVFLNNTLYDGSVGFNGTNTSDRGTFINNIISGFTTPATWVTHYDTNFFDYNVWHDSDVVVRITKGNNDLDQDPGFVNPGSDFRLQLPIYGQQTQGTSGGGLVVGAVQDKYRFYGGGA